MEVTFNGHDMNSNQNIWTGGGEQSRSQLNILVVKVETPGTAAETPTIFVLGS